MWLVYLRFEDSGQVKTYHVTAENKRRVDSIFALAEQHGLSKVERLVEYAFFMPGEQCTPSKYQIPTSSGQSLKKSGMM